MKGLNLNPFYLKCNNCGNSVKKISKFKDLIFKKDLICQKCQSKFESSKFFLFFVRILNALNIVFVFIFAYYAQKFLFPNTDEMKLVSFAIGIFLYLIIMIFLNCLIPYKNTNLKAQGE